MVLENLFKFTIHLKSICLTLIYCYDAAETLKESIPGHTLRVKWVPSRRIGMSQLGASNASTAKCTPLSGDQPNLLKVVPLSAICDIFEISLVLVFYFTALFQKLLYN